MLQKKKFLLAGLMLIASALIQPSVAAPLLANSTLSIRGGVAVVPSGPASGATGLDFLNNGVAGTPGGTIGLDSNGSGSFAGFFTAAGCPGQCGTIVDLGVGTLATGVLAIDSFFTVTQGLSTVFFDMEEITGVTRLTGGVTTLVVDAIGVFRFGAFTPTPAVFTITVQGHGSTTFSASAVSEGGTTPDVTVPEPASLAVFGMGLLGVAAARRMRRRLRA